MRSWQSNLGKIPVGIYEKALPLDMTWHERLTAAYQAGYDFLEISIDDGDMRLARLDWGASDRAALRQAVRDSGVPITSLSLSAHRRFPLGSASPGLRQRALDVFRKAVDFAHEFGLRHVLVAGAMAYYEDHDPGMADRFLDGLERGFEWASAAGVTLALENWDICIDSIQKVMQYVDHFNSPRFRVYGDIGNLVYAGYDPLAELALGQGHFAAIHVKDTIPGQLRYVPLGEGSVPFVDCFARLAEIGFQGPLALELWTERYPDSVEIVAAARQWLQSRMEAGWRMALESEIAGEEHP